MGQSKSSHTRKTLNLEPNKAERTSQFTTEDIRRRHTDLGGSLSRSTSNVNTDSNKNYGHVNVSESRGNPEQNVASQASHARRYENFNLNENINKSNIQEMNPEDSREELRRDRIQSRLDKESIKELEHKSTEEQQETYRFAKSNLNITVNWNGKSDPTENKGISRLNNNFHNQARVTSSFQNSESSMNKDKSSSSSNFSENTFQNRAMNNHTRGFNKRLGYPGYRRRNNIQVDDNAHKLFVDKEQSKKSGEIASDLETAAENQKTSFNKGHRSSYAEENESNKDGNFNKFGKGHEERDGSQRNFEQRNIRSNDRNFAAGKNADVLDNKKDVQDILDVQKYDKNVVEHNQGTRYQRGRIYTNDRGRRYQNERPRRDLSESGRSDHSETGKRDQSERRRQDQSGRGQRERGRQDQSGRRCQNGRGRSDLSESRRNFNHVAPLNEHQSRIQLNQKSHQNRDHPSRRQQYQNNRQLNISNPNLYDSDHSRPSSAHSDYTGGWNHLNSENPSGRGYLVGHNPISHQVRNRGQMHRGQYNQVGFSQQIPSLLGSGNLNPRFEGFSNQYNPRFNRQRSRGAGFSARRAMARRGKQNPHSNIRTNTNQSEEVAKEKESESEDNSGSDEIEDESEAEEEEEESETEDESEAEEEEKSEAEDESGAEQESKDDKNEIACKPFQVLALDFTGNFPLSEGEAKRRNINLNEAVKDVLLIGKQGNEVIRVEPRNLRDIMHFVQKYPNANAVSIKDN